MASLLSLLAGLFLPLAVVDTAEQLKELKSAYKAKESATAVRIFDQLVQSFELAPPKEQEEIVKAVEQAFTTRKDEGDDVVQLFVAASASLANMGPAGEKAIVRAIALKHLRSKPLVLATLVEGLGRQVNPAMVDQLLPWLRPDKTLGVNAAVVVGAVNALARFREADPKLRKRIVGELVAVYVDLDAKYRAEHAKPEPSAELETAFQQIEKPLIDSLRTLSGSQFENSEGWKTWWATAKTEDWSKEGGS